MLTCIIAFYACFNEGCNFPYSFLVTNFAAISVVLFAVFEEGGRTVTLFEITTETLQHVHKCILLNLKYPKGLLADCLVWFGG
jgi:hypothetical protein